MHSGSDQHRIADNQSRSSSVHSGQGHKDRKSSARCCSGRCHDRKLGTVHFQFLTGGLVVVEVVWKSEVELGPATSRDSTGPEFHASTRISGSRVEVCGIRDPWKSAIATVQRRRGSRPLFWKTFPCAGKDGDLQVITSNVMENVQIKLSTSCYQHSSLPEKPTHS